MNGLIQYKINENLSRNLHHNKFYMVTTKDTYYAIHKIDKTAWAGYSKKRRAMAAPISKPSVLSFIEKEHIQTFKQYLESHLKDGFMFNRNVQPYGDKGLLYSERMPISSFSPPLSVYTISASDLELMCILNYFDMLIITGIKKQEDSSITVYGYEHVIREPPNRQMMEYKLRQLM